MTELEELRLAYAECSHQRNQLLTQSKLIHAKLERQEAEIMELRKSRNWTSVKNKMPPKGGRYLVAFNGLIGLAHTFVEHVCEEHPLGYLIQGHGGSHNQVTHWMELPDLPEGESTGDDHG